MSARALPRSPVAAGGGRARIIGSTFMVTVGLILPLWILLSARSIPDVRLAAVLILLTLYAGGHLAALITSGEPRIVEGAFWLFVYVAMGVAPLCQLSTGLHSILAGDEYLLPAAILVLVGCCCWDVGAWVGRRSEGRHLSSRRRLSEARLTAMSILGILASAYYVHALNGLEMFFTSRTEVSESLTRSGLRTDTSEVGAALIGGLGSIPSAICWLGWVLIIVRSGRGRAGRWVWLVVLSLVNLVVNNPISHGRYWLLTIVFALCFILPGDRDRRFRFVIALGIVGALLVFPYLDFFRRSDEVRTFELRPVTQMLSVKDYDQLTMTANGVWLIQGDGHTLGRQFLGDVLFWFPRTMWPGKPLDTGTLIGRNLGGQNDNLSAPLWIELWVDFAWPGVIVGFYVMGRVSQRADDAFVRLPTARGEVWLLELALPLAAGFQFIILRGSLLQAMSRLAVIAVTIVFLGPRRGRDDTAQPALIGEEAKVS